MLDMVVKCDMIHSSTTKRESKMTTYTKLTAKQNMVMMDFMAVAKTNGVQILFAAKKKSLIHALIAPSQVHGLRYTTTASSLLSVVTMRHPAPKKH